MKKMILLLSVLFLLNACTEKAYASEGVKNSDDVDLNLMQACGDGNLDLVKSLIKNGADINFINERGYTPLMFAARRGDNAIVDELLKKNPKINGKNYNPLLAIARSGNVDMIIKLIKAGANPNDQDGNNDTPLAMAVDENNIYVVEALLRNGANNFDIQPTNQYEYPPLIGAVVLKETEMVKVLLKAGADPNLLPRKGTPEYLGYTFDPPLINALINDDIDTVKEILKYNPNINIRGEHSRTPLMAATLSGYYDFIELILRYNPNVNLKDEDGHTALDYIYRENDSNIKGEYIKLLQSHGAKRGKLDED